MILILNTISNGLIFASLSRRRRCMKLVSNLRGGYNKYSTKAVKGICAILVMLSHIFGQLSWVGYIAVGIFFCFSGYGLLYSWKTKDNYLDGFIKKRIARVVTPFLVVYIVSIVLHIIIGGPEEISDFVEKIVSLKFLPSAWYVVAIVYFYLGFYVIAKSAKSEKRILFCMIFFWIAYCFICIVTKWNTFWYNSSFGFVIGLLGAICIKNDSIRIDKNKKYLFLWTTVTLAVFILAACTPRRLITDVLYSSILTIAVAVFVISYEIQSNLLNKIGDVSYEIYLIHPLVIFCVKQANFDFWLAAVMDITLSIFLAFLWNMLEDKIVFTVNKL